MGRIIESIVKYSRALGAGGDPADARRHAAGTPSRGSCQPVLDEPVGQRRSGTLKRVERRPDPHQWSEDELLALHEAVYLLWPQGPVTVSSLRTAIAKGELVYAKVAGQIFTTRAALSALAACEKRAAGDGGADRKQGVDWDAHLKSLLPKRGGS